MNAVHNQNEKQSIATTYNKLNGGVDMNDMMSGVYDDHRKSKSFCTDAILTTINFFHERILSPL
jgi:hypothetical protein